MYSTLKTIQKFNECYLYGIKCKENKNEYQKFSNNQINYLNANPNNPLNCISSIKNKNYN